MRTLCYYRQDKRVWISPSDLWEALRSDEGLCIIAPELTCLDAILVAFGNAAEILMQKWLSDVKNGLISALWCICAILVLIWPPLAAKMPEVVQEVLLGAFAVGILTETVFAAQFLRKKRLLASGEAKIRAAMRKTTKMFPPAEFHRSGADFPEKSLKIVTLCLLALFLLNSVVLAFPGRPAVVFPSNGDSYIAKFPQLVIMGTKWEWRKEYYIETAVALLAVSEDEETASVLKIAYRVWQPDILKNPGPWRTWAVSRLEWLTAQISDSIWQNLPPEMEKGARREALMEAYENPELRDMVAQAFVQHFNEHHNGIMKLTVIRLEVVEISLGDYITIARTQNKE
jgi:hypothetical protein